MAERLQIDSQRTVVGMGGGHSFESAYNGSDMACWMISMATSTSQSRNFPTDSRIYMDLVVVNRVLEHLSIDR
jgi:hypothetical protein